MDWGSLTKLFEGFTDIGDHPKLIAMLAIGCILLYLGIVRKFEPLLLVGIGTGIVLANLPLGEMVKPATDTETGGILYYFYKYLLSNEIIPLLIFLGLGALTDFTPLLNHPFTILLGAAAQLGVFVAMVGAVALGFGLREAASIGIIGGADGPTTIFVATKMQELGGQNILGPVAVAAYSYMALVPIIQPPIIKAMCSKEERAIKMQSLAGTVSQRTKILFPIITVLVVGLLAPKATPLIGCLMFGNLLRECGAVESLSLTAQNELANIVTILLGITVGGMMSGTEFLRPETILVFTLGIVAFSLDTVAGVALGKLMCVLSGRKVNPMIGACGISAFPMSSRVVQKLGLEANPYNHLLMHAAGANTAGQIASVVAGGVMLMLVPMFA